MLNRLQIKVHLVGSGPGDPGLITVRGLQCLQQAQVVIYDRLANPLLLSYAPYAEWIDAGKQPDNHLMSQDQINDLIVQKAKQGKSVVRLKGGDPYVFGRGGEEALALKEAGIPFEIVPGVTSAIAAPTYAGIPVTHRNIAQSVSIITGHSAKQDNLPEKWSCIAGASGTLVFLMGVHNLPNIIKRLLEGGCSIETPVAVIEQGTCSNQKTIIGTLANIQEISRQIQPPAIIIVGDVVALREKLRWFDLETTSPLLGLNILNTFGLEETFTENNVPGMDNGLFSHHIDEFTQKVTLLGANPIHIPAFRLVKTTNLHPLNQAVQRLKNGTGNSPPYEWVIFTNSSAIKFFMQHIRSSGFDSRIFSGAKIGVIGKETAHKLSSFGLVADQEFSVDNGLVLTKGLEMLRGSQLLLPQSEENHPELSLVLNELKISVDKVMVCDLEPILLNETAQKNLTLSNNQIITFFSPAAVYAFKESLSQIEPASGIKSFLEKSGIACINPATAKAVLDVGLRTEIFPGEFSIDGLVQEIVSWWQVHNHIPLPN